MKAKFNRKVMTDILTGLPNRRKLLEQVSLNDKNRCEESSDTAVIVVVLDAFKIVKNQYNHRNGILIEISNRLKDNLRNTDMVARWTGNEFLILLPQTNANQAYGVAENLRHKIADVAIEVEDFDYGITATFGVSSYHNDDTFEETLINTGAAIIPQKPPECNRVVLI
ncbi:MAG: GGDEF domain-containing protein [Proteobacteria bacterium]|nr:GGDEF domain-containing protein [Pseudomonadota bacterium]